MNRVYRLIWSHVAASFIPVAEFTAGKKGKTSRTSKRKLLLAGLLVAGAMPVATLAEDVEWTALWPDYAFSSDPEHNFDQVERTGYAFTIDGESANTHYPLGTALTILGDIPALPDVSSAGNGIQGRSVTVLDALSGSGLADDGRILAIQATDSQGNTVAIDASNIHEYNYSPVAASPQQNQELNVVVPGLEGSYQVVSVYDSASFIPAEDTPVAGMTLPVYDPNSVRIMYQFGIVNVVSDGAATVNIGADTASDTAIASAQNTLDLLTKDSTLARAQGETATDSRVSWQSDNYIHFRPAAVISSQVQNISAQSTQYNYSMTLPNYVSVAGRVVQLGSKTFTINSSADIAEVNDFLTGQGSYSGRSQIQYWLTRGATINGDVISSAVEAQEHYNAIIEQLLAQAESTSTSLSYYAWDDRGAYSNNATLSTGALRVIYATGKNASGLVTSEGSLAVDGASSVMEADNNAAITNDGAINAWRSSGSSPQSVGMRANNATATNNGTLNAGLFLEKDGSNQQVNNAGAVAMSGSGDSTLINNGHINTGITNSATHNAWGMIASGNTQATNAASGTIVLTDNSHNTNGRGGGYGVQVSDNASFVNLGAIILGAAPLTSSDTPEAVNLVGSGDLSAGIYTQSTASVENAAGANITMMNKTRNAAGMLAEGNAGTVTNNGDITVLGTLTAGAAAANYGMYVQDNSGAVTNNGTIQVDGDNNIALNILALTADASMTSTRDSTITVGSVGNLGGSDEDPYSYRNYAVYAEGLNGNAATVAMDSRIRLLSAGAIGVHARGDASINIGNNSMLTFENEQQIGYYAWGQGATINISNPTITDNAQAGSILFAVDHGAAFTGTTTGGSYNLEVSGAGSTGVFANGVDNLNNDDDSDDVATRISTGTSSIRISGDGAVGVKVTGGAEGIINDGSLQLTGDRTTAVLVDGRDYNITGTVGSTPRSTKVTSGAAIGSGVGQNGIVAYNVAYLGDLTLNTGANVDLLGNNSTGILLHHNGVATVNAGISVSGSNNTGVDIQNAGTLTNHSVITVSGEAGSENVGVRVQGSGAVVNQLGSVNATGGKAAVELTGDGASLTVNGTGNHITAGGDADGVLIDSTGASSFSASDTQIDVTGSGAGINNFASSSNIKLNRVTINAADGPAIRTAVTFTAEGSNNVLNVDGSGSGFAFMQADGSQTTGDLTIGNGYVINGTGADSTGVLARTNGAVTSGTQITMGAQAGAAIDAAGARSLSNSGTINSASSTSSTVVAQNVATFSNSGTIHASDTTNSSATVVLNGDIASRTVTNSGSLISDSQAATVIDASGTANTTLTNSGTLQAASAIAQAILTGSGNDSVTLNGGALRGEITEGSGSDQFTWTRGTLDGGVTFTGNDGQDRATIGDVDMSATTHILSDGGTGSTLTLNGTHATDGSATIGSLDADDLSLATNIGSGWSTLTVDGASADVRVVNDLTLSGTSVINVNNGATLRSADSVTDSDAATIHDYNITTQGAGSLLSFDGASQQTYRGVISGDGRMERIGGGNTLLLGDNTYTGNTLIGQASELTLGNGGTVGSLSETTDIIDNGTLTVFRSNAVTLNGILSGTGNFRQTGTGITRLGGNNRYGGTTSVEDGTLLINGVQSGRGLTTVYTGATLGGYGTIGGDVLFNAGSTLMPGDERRGNGVGTLTINGNLTLASDTNSQFQLGEAYTSGGSLNDLVQVNGDLNLDGDLNVGLTQGGSFLPGVYRLFNYSGALVDKVLEIASLPPNESHSYSVQTNIDHQVNLVLNFTDPSQALEFWDGDDNGVNHGDGISGNDSVDGGYGYWTALISGVSNNWTHEDGHGNAPWAQSAFAVFQAEANRVLLSNEFGTVRASGMQFTSDGYHLLTDPLHVDSVLSMVGTAMSEGVTPDNSYTGKGGTQADGYFVVRVGDGAQGADVTATVDVDLVQNNAGERLRLLKTDPGRLILNGDNQYRGGTEIQAGTLQASKDSSLGENDTFVLLKNGATFQAGADFTSSRRYVVDGTAGGTLDTYGHTFAPQGGISGSGALAVVDTSAGSDDGMLDLNVRNDYQGDTTITGKKGNGTLTVNANVTGALGGNASSQITLSDDARLSVNNNASAQSHSVAVNGATLAFTDTASAGNSTLTLLEGNAQFTDESNAGSATIAVDADSLLRLSDRADAGSSVTTNAGTVAFAGTAQAAGARIANQHGGKVTLQDAAGRTSVGSLSGEGDVELGSATLSEGALNLNDLIDGIISGVGSLEKVGDGILTLTGANTWTGATSVQNGVLLVNGQQQAATGITTIAAGATLGGNGTLGGNVTINDNGHLAPGATLDSVGQLNMDSLTLADNASLDFQFGQSGTPGGALNDLLNVTGDLTLDGKLNISETAGGQFDVGVYRVINYGGTLTNNLLEIGTAPAAADDLYVQTSINGQVNLVNRTGTTLRFWDGFGGTGNALKNNGKIDGGDGIWQNSHGNDNWTTDQTTPEGAFNAPFSDGAYAVFSGQAGKVTVDNSLGSVLISGAQFTTDGYTINEGVITTHTADTVLRVGDGTLAGQDYTATINSRIDGSGGVRKTDLGTLILNGDNQYQGGTTVSGGVLQVAADRNLGVDGSGITLNGGTLRYGDAFDTARQLTLRDEGGTVDTNGHSVSLLTAVAGEGALTKAGAGTLILTKDSTWQGATTISDGALQLGEGSGQGSVNGDVLNNGDLIVNRNNTLALNGTISGSGDVIQRGSGTTVLNGANQWQGITLVENGTLRAGGTNRFSASSSHIVSLNAQLDTAGYSQTVANLVNQGTVNLRGNGIGSSLTVKGNYVGMNGTIALAAEQASVAVADTLVIDGGKASGSTLLDIDVSRLGQPTQGDGIRVVQATNGATTTAQTTQDAFTLGEEKLTAGAWQYQLYAGDAAGKGEDWFLRAGYNPAVPGFDALASIVRQGDLLVLGTLHQRVGDEQPGNPDVTDGNNGRFWARYLVKTVDQRLNDATRSTSRSQYNGMQMGIDLWQNDTWRSGLYTTFMDTDTSVNGNTGMGGGASYNSTFSTYLGGYATWTDSDGLYVDNVLQYGYHAVDLENRSEQQTYHPNGNTVTASVEVGKPWTLGSSRWAVEPQAQLVWQWSHFDDVTLSDDASTHVNMHTDSSLVGRLGARLTADYDTHYGKVKPYVRVNYWQSLSGGDDAVTWRNGESSNSSTTLKSSQSFSTTEAALGATWAVSRDVQAYSEVGKSWDNGGDSRVDSDVSASVGLKMRF